MLSLPGSIDGLLTEPTFGIPIALVGGVLVGWLVANVRGSAPVAATRTTWHRPDHDAVSQTFYAAEDGIHSQLIRAAYDRLDRSLHATFQVGLTDLGWRPWRTRGQEVPDRRRLLGLREGLSRRYTEAVQREDPGRIHWAFWRDPAIEEQRFLARVAVDVHDARLTVQRLERRT
ncbi:MAG: hypothetical protein ACREDK_05975 [Thermoplasmata archaeon]